MGWRYGGVDGQSEAKESRPKPQQQGGGAGSKGSTAQVQEGVERSGEWRGTGNDVQCVFAAGRAGKLGVGVHLCQAPLDAILCTGLSDGRPWPYACPDAEGGEAAAMLSMMVMPLLQHLSRPIPCAAHSYLRGPGAGAMVKSAIMRSRV